MKLKIEFIEAVHLPEMKDESKSWTFKVKHKKKVIHDGFMAGPFFKSKEDAKQAINSWWSLNSLLIQSDLNDVI